MAFIKLSMVVSERDRHGFVDENDTGEGEDDGIVAALRPGEATSPTLVNIDQIRNLYPRKPRRDGVRPEGSRITFYGGSGMAVTETFDEVTGLIEQANR